MTRWPGSGEGPRETSMQGSLIRASLDRRVVLVTGPLDGAQASAAATVMTLDAVGDARVEPRLSAHGRLRLGEPDSGITSRASELERALVTPGARRDERFGHLASRRGPPVEANVAAWSRGTNVAAEDALGLGYVDAVQGTGTQRWHPGPS